LKEEKNFNMIITIKNDDGTTSYDVSNIEDEGSRTNATVMIQKVGNLEIILEALNFASATHRGNLETLLKENPEAIVEEEGETDTNKVDVEQSDEESSEEDS
tara:strand:- start:3192 stop:3497 length:306 start_codon:yes stop_codon:yes gene_type:complete